MTLQKRVFLRVLGLLTLLIVSVCVTAAVFSIKEHREIVKDSFRAQAVFLAGQVERLVLWDDRVALKALLVRLTREQTVVAYAFVDKSGAPYVDTFRAGVPRALFKFAPVAGEAVSLTPWKNAAGEYFFDVATPLGHDEGTLHIGLARRQIDLGSRPKIWTIAILGLTAIVVGVMLAWATAVVTTREVNTMTDALKLSEERVRLLLSSAAEGVFGIDTTGNCTFINPAARGMLGYANDDELIGRNMHDLVHHTHFDGSPCPKVDCLIQNALKSGDGAHSDNEIFWRRDASCFPVEFWSHPIVKNGAAMGAVVTFVDISERREAENERVRLQNQLFDARKMEALGQLAGGVAHDFNNLLSPIILISEVLLDDLAPESAEAGYLGDVLQAARRARKLVHQILSYSRPEEREKTKVHLTWIVDDAMDLVRSSLPTGITMQQDMDTALPAVTGIADELHQVVMNLLTNAAQAMKGRGGTIRISLRELVLAEPRVTERGTLDRGTYVVLAVADDGCGMDETTQDHVFEPFFSTKKGEEGAGLGLAIVDRIVSGHGGLIAVSSRNGVGTTFEVYLPGAKEPRAEKHLADVQQA